MAFPFGEGGTALAVTEEVQYMVSPFSALRRKEPLPPLTRSPLPKGEGKTHTLYLNFGRKTS